MTESLPLILACLAVGAALAVAFMLWLERSKTVDARAEAIKVLTAGASALSKLSSNDDIIAAANARKAAEAVALEALKAKIASL
jgi:hypothetical protein